VLFRRKQKPLTREQSLAAVPIKNQHIEETQAESGEITLFVPMRKVWWLRVLSKVLYVPKGRRIALDELGSTVWQLIDGRANVGAIIDRFARQYKLSRREAELSVVAYMRTLMKRGLVGMAVLEKPPQPGKRPGRRKKRKSRR